VNKSELIEKLAEKSGINVMQAEEVVNLIYKKMRETMVSGGRIEIRGFGSFVVKEYQSYQGRNPKTGEIIPVNPKRGLLFRTGKELRDRVNRGASAASPSGNEPSGNSSF